MEQNLLFEVVDSLLLGDIHPRQLARRLGVNHMSVNRRLKDLLSSNVVDCNEAGRNKNYFLKKNVESRGYVFMAEHYKLLKFLDKNPRFRRLFEKIHSDKGIQLALLFGSYAKGLEKDDSDSDLYIETKSKKTKEELESSDTRLSIKIGDYNQQSSLAKEIEKNHVIIKGVERYYEKTGFFNKN
jgi:predicted nucleotidyltransferase